VKLADYNDKYCTLKSVRPLAEPYLQTANSGQRSEGYAALSLIALRFALQPPLVHGGRHAHKPITASHKFPGHAHPYGNRPSYREPGSAPPNRRGPQRNARNAGRLFCRWYGDFKVSHYEQDNVAGGLEREVPQRVFKLRFRTIGPAKSDLDRGRNLSQKFLFTGDPKKEARRNEE
jgi:hypothetical protein